MVHRVHLAGLAVVMGVSACTQFPTAPAAKAPATQPGYTVQQGQVGDEGTTDASLDALIRQLDVLPETATESATPESTTENGQQTQSVNSSTYSTQQWWYNPWYGGFGYYPFATRCRRVFRNCVFRSYGSYSFCRRVYRRCLRVFFYL